MYQNYNCGVQQASSDYTSMEALCIGFSGLVEMCLNFSKFNPIFNQVSKMHLMKIQHLIDSKHVMIFGLLLRVVGYDLG